MNINKIFKLFNRQIDAISESEKEPTTDLQHAYNQGVIHALDLAMKTINEVNLSEGDVPENQRFCLGWGQQVGVCRNRVSHRFLILFCDRCDAERLANSDRPLYNTQMTEPDNEPVILPLNVGISDKGTTYVI